jgi:hypothetical protein
MPNCNAFPAFELTCHVTVRSETFHAKTFYAFLAATDLCVVLLPLFVTNSTSYGAAEKVCYDRSSSMFNVIFSDEDSPKYNPDWDMDDNAINHLFPQHMFNSLSTVVSLFGFGVWLFFSPHQSDVAKDLDRTRKCSDLFYVPWFVLSNAFFIPPCMSVNLVGSYFVVQWLANLIVTALALTGYCTSSQTVNVVGGLLAACATFGLSTTGTNLLCHRYLCEKARIMIKLYVGRMLSSRSNLRRPDNLAIFLEHRTALTTLTIPQSNGWGGWKDLWYGKLGACSLSRWECPCSSSTHPWQLSLEDWE